MGVESSQDTLEAPPSLVEDDSRVPCLTVLFHPDPDRIGERLRLPELDGAGRIEIGRDAPALAQPGSSLERALEDRFVSRKPLIVVGTPGGARVEAAEGVKAVVDGATLAAPVARTNAQLESGVVIELARRVVLLLHRVGPERPLPPALGLVGANEAMDELRRNVIRVADLPVPVLIRGETGTGKELVARAVHRASARSPSSFVSVNMAAIPASTAASELFGHAKGAFTGAGAEHEGYFGKADRGTLFLDEIGATPMDVQPMLLRALESREIQPLGSGSPRNVDARLIAATDADLEQAISNESFRAALLHRLEGYQLFLPPLRDRRDDIGRLMLHFLRGELAATGESHRLERSDPDGPTWMPASLVARLARLDWPGNVRQLRNVIRQLAISSRGAESLRIDAAVSRLLEPAEAAADSAAPEPSAAAPRDIDDNTLIAALREHGWQPNAAAAKLGISRSTMYERMKRCDRIRQAKQIGADEIAACKERLGGDVDAMAAELEVSKRALRMRMRELGLS